MPVMRDAQGRPFSMMACPACAAAGPHLPVTADQEDVFECFRCAAIFADTEAAAQRDAAD